MDTTHPIPDDALDADIAILGRKGGGKTYTSKGIVERLLDMGRRVLVLDPLGVWAGLRTSADGDGPGYPVAIFGGLHADMPLDTAAAVPMADVLARENVPAVIDLSELTKGAQQGFLLAFLHELRRVNTEALTIVLEEADVFCLSADTEILAKRGWLKWSEIREGEEVACFDPASEAYVFGSVERVVTRQHHGEMIRLKTKGLDCLVTPDHRVVMRRYHRGNHSPRGLRDWIFSPASSVPTSVGVPIGGAPCGSGLPGLTHEMARILGWVITDGSIHDARQEHRAYAIEQSDSTVKAGLSIADEMDRVLMSLPSVTRYDRKARETTSGGRTRKHAASRRWYISGETASTITAWLDDDIHRIPRIIIEAANRNQLEGLFLGLLEGDGTHRGRWSNFYPGQNEGLADDFQEIALRLGVNATKSWSKTISQWYVCMAPLRPHHWVRKPSRETYSGIVWDVTVPTGAFVARRNGRAFVTGNCPQNPMGEDSKQLHHEIDWIARRGRFKGFRLITICQRPARLSKDVLTQAATLVAHRLPAPQDRDAVKAWVDGNGDKDQAKEVFDTLARLEVGEAWVWASEQGSLERRKFPVIKTLDTSATPKAGEKRIAPKRLADVDVSAIRTALATAQKPATKPAQNIPENITTQIAAAERNGFERGWTEGNREGRALLAHVVAREIGSVRTEIDRILSLPQLNDAGSPSGKATGFGPVIAGSNPAPAAKPAPATKPEKRADLSADPLLNAALQVWPVKMTWAGLASMCGRKARGGHFNSARKRLVDNGFIREEGDLVVIANPPKTPAGIAPADLLEQNLPQPAQKMFVSIRRRPGVSIQSLADDLGMQPRGGHWNTGMSTLRRNGLISEGDGLRIAPGLEGGHG